MVQVVMTTESGGMDVYEFPRRTAKRRARALMDQSWLPGYIGERYVRADYIASRGSWQLELTGADVARLLGA